MNEVESSRAKLKKVVELTQRALEHGDFARALDGAKEAMASAPHEPKGWILKAQALAAQHRVEEALETLRDALRVHGDDRKVLAQARSLALVHGRFAEAARYALRLLDVAPEDHKNHRLLTQCWMAAGEFESVAAFLRGREPGAAQPTFGKLAYLREYQRLKQAAPSLVAAWRLALENKNSPQPSAAIPPESRLPLILYWSQGSPPGDVQIVVSAWQRLLENSGIGEIELFNRTSATEWIANNAPEFSAHFSKAFHFAMEADVFRLAFASKRRSIYVDIDSWPLENTAEILKFGLRQDRSLLYFRSHTPLLANGFFMATPQCPFFRELSSQCLAVDLDQWPRDRDTILKTFGPVRYNGVLQGLINKGMKSEAFVVDSVPGCSKLRTDGDELYFTHEAAVASTKPPFSLDYKSTEDSWKKAEQ